MAITAEDDARKVRIERGEAWAKLQTADKIYATKGRKLLEWEPSAETQDEILDVVIGRSGNLRAPTIYVNNVYIVGFDEAVYQQYLA